MIKKWIKLPLFFFGSWLLCAFATLAVLRLIGVDVDSQGVRVANAAASAFAALFCSAMAAIDGDLVK